MKNVTDEDDIVIWERSPWSAVEIFNYMSRNNNLLKPFECNIISDFVNFYFSKKDVLLYVCIATDNRCLLRERIKERRLPQDKIDNDRFIDECFDRYRDYFTQYVTNTFDNHIILSAESPKVSNCECVYNKILSLL